MSKIFKNKDYQIPRENRCCVCGVDDKEQLTRHHIVPSCYSGKLTKMPELKKKLLDMHQYYYEWDYSCVCFECHQRYEREWSQAMHFRVCEIYNVDLDKTSYKRPDNGLKPSEVVMQQIETVEEYLKLRKFCAEYFKRKMNPKFPLL